MPKSNKAAEALRKALLDLDLDLPELNFVVRDAISRSDSAQFHITDRTPVVIDPDIGDGGPRESCFNGVSLDIGGKASTGRDGRMRWKLTDYIYERGRIALDEPVSFVATARADRAVIMTSNTVSVGRDVEIDVFSWDPSGAPAPNTRFSWRCWMHQPPIID